MRESTVAHVQIAAITYDVNVTVTVTVVVVGHLSDATDTIATPLYVVPLHTSHSQRLCPQVIIRSHVVGAGR